MQEAKDEGEDMKSWNFDAEQLGKWKLGWCWAPSSRTTGILPKMATLLIGKTTQRQGYFQSPIIKSEMAHRSMNGSNTQGPIWKKVNSYDPMWFGSFVAHLRIVLMFSLACNDEPKMLFVHFQDGLEIHTIFHLLKDLKAAAFKFVFKWLLRVAPLKQIDIFHQFHIAQRASNY